MVSTTITMTARYGYSVLVQVAGEADQTITGSAYVVAADSNPLGAGWTFAGVDRLVSIASDGNGPAGMLRLYGTGGFGFYEGTSTFTSPTGDNGTLSLSGGTYTYSTPDGQSSTFNGSGYQTLWTSADGYETLQYRYDGSNRISGITAIDGALTTITYTGSTQVVFETVNGRKTTLTLSSGDLTKVTNPDGGVHSLVYSSHRLTQEQFGPNLENNWAYTSAGVLGTMTWGAVTVGGVTNLSRTVLSPGLTRGLGALVAGTVWASVTDPTGHTEKYELDASGRILQYLAGDGAKSQAAYTNGYVTSETDALGRATTYTRDGSGYVTRVELPDGSLLTYQYQSAFHALTTMVDERGNTTVNAFDGSGHLIRTIDALGNGVTYTYSTGLLESIIDARGGITTLVHDASRRLSAEVNALGERTSYTYDLNGNIETIKDALNRVTTLVNDTLGRTTVRIDALAGRATSTFDPAGLLLTTADQLNTQTSTTYDPFKRGLVAQMINGAGASVRATTLESYDDAGRTTRSRDANGWWSQSAFDGAGRLTLSTDARGGTTGSVYDLAGRLVRWRDAMGRWSENVYDDRDRVVVQINALGERVTMAYDRAGNLTTVTDALGRVYTSIYDALNRQTGSIDALGRRTTTTHDAAGNVSTITDFLNRTTSYTHDLLNRQTKVTEAVGTSVARTTETGFDTVGNVKTSKDALGNVYTYTYDDLDRLIETLDPLGNRATNTYDAASNLITMKDALGKVYTSVYDPLHRLVATIDPAGTRTTSVLDASGQQTASIDGLGNVSVSMIDELGRGVGSVDARGAVVLNQLDASGSLRMLTDQVGNEWRWSVDGLGRESVRFDPAGKATTTTYDIAGRVSTVTDRLGQQMLYTYDTGDRTSQVVWKNAGGTAVNTIVYSYDDNDNLLTAADSAGTVTYTHDELNRTRTYTNIFGQSLTYTYDLNSNVTLREDSLGGVLTSVYDTGGRLTSRRYGGSGETPVRVDFGYTNRDELGTITRYSDLAGTTLVGTTSYTYDDPGRLTSILNKNASAATLSYYNYTLDNADRVSTHTWWSQVGTVVYSGTKTYTYDTTDQLTNDSSTTFTYDDAGNRTMSGYTTGVANRITNDGVYTYTYDDAGNMTQQSKGASLETWYFGYDVGNRLTSIRKTSDGSTNLLLITYTYDPEGKRVKEEKWESGVGTTTTRMAFDGMQAWADLDNGNVVQVRYVWGDERTKLLSRTNTSVGVRWLMQDSLSSVRDVADAAGALVDHIDYGSFGAITTESHPAESGRFGFTAFAKIDGSGMLWGSETRVMHTAIGGWTQDDPIFFQAGDANVRRYTGNSPTNWIDPSGLKIQIKHLSTEKEILALIKQMDPDGDYNIDQFGFLVVGKNAKAVKNSKYPGIAEKLRALVSSRNLWTIDGSVGNSNLGMGIQTPLFPFTTPNSNSNGFKTRKGKGSGTGGVIYIPLKDSKLEFGVYDKDGKAQLASLVIIFGHELLGHAYYLDRGEHVELSPRDKKKNRTDHDQAVKVENELRRALGIKTIRGLYNKDSTTSGESLWRKKGAKEWNRFPKEPNQKDINL